MKILLQLFRRLYEKTCLLWPIECLSKFDVAIIKKTVKAISFFLFQLFPSHFYRRKRFRLSVSSKLLSQ
ncbi:MAG: hypothetical protein AAGB46_14565, partial [Verrucomicrobiota bacterium]